MSQALNITTDDLKEIVATAVTAAITESRKPNPPTEQEVAALELKQQHRSDSAASVIATQENKISIQHMCSHEHSKREGGGTHCVYVREEDPRSPGYIYCQRCEGKVRPGEYDKKGLPSQRDTRAIFDTALFNRLFQECGEQALMG